MKKLEFSYSLKNIPIPSKIEYQKALTDKVEKFLARIRWKLFWYRNQENRKQKLETYGFRSTKYPPTSKELREFENDIMDLISRVEMKYHSNPLQEKLRMDKQMIRNCKDLIISADKTGNFYQVDPKEYQKHLKNTITKDYQKVNESVLENINNEAANIASKLQLDYRIDAMGLNQGYITIKDHKTTFPNRLDFRLINPCKSQIGKISKKILEDINARVRDSTMVCQWRSTGEMLEWFRSLKEKKKLSFVQYDIEAFYPSITKDLLMQSINYAKSITIVKDEEIDIILHARKSVLETDGDVWMKKDCPEFDVTMGGLDGAEVCETTGL